jgi:hypothetical protein
LTRCLVVPRHLAKFVCLSTSKLLLSFLVCHFRNTHPCLLVVLFLSLCSCEGRFCFSTLPISSHRCVSFGHFVALFVSRRWVEVYITSPQTQGSLLGKFQRRWRFV